MGNTLLAPVKTEKEILENSMSEDDPNANTQLTCDIGKQPRWGPRHKGAQELAELISPGKKLQEWVCVVTCCTLFLWAGLLLAGRIRMDASTVLAAFLSILTADFCSGFVHWAADTWGTVDLPLVGKTLIRRFREHHIDPASLTRHNFVETNGDNFAVVIPIVATVIWRLHTYDNTRIDAEIYWFSYWYIGTLFIAMTNQIHKWSHTYFGLPTWVVMLQKSHVVLPRSHHRIHHVAPHDTYYCITTGWLNWPLEKLHFWSALETLVEALTGCKPRSDDMMWSQKGM